jgi:hypothetical protein
MNHTIDNLVRQFERGSLTRRQLVQALLMVAASPALAQERPVGAFRPTGIDHVQITVSDLKATQQFYEKLFGVTTTSPNPTQLSLDSARRAIPSACTVKAAQLSRLTTSGSKSKTFPRTQPSRPSSALCRV